MPRKTSQSVPSGDRQASSGMPRFVRCELSDTDRDAVREGILSHENALLFLEEMVIAGIKVSLAYEKQNDCMACYATGGPNSGKEYAGLCLTSRGPSVIGAISALQYKHVHILGGDWSSAEGFGSGEKWG